MQSDYIQIARIRGTEERYKPNMVKNDFYILCRKNPYHNIGLRSKGMFVFENTNINYFLIEFISLTISLISLFDRPIQLIY
jgi:hypothetical protein